jgi:thiol:disulfide interchange protein DsbD
MGSIKKNGFLFLLLLTGLFESYAQMVLPAKWSVKTSVAETKVGETIELIFTTGIPGHNHIYANEYKCDPLMVELIIKKNNSFEIVGKPKAVGVHRYVDDVFNCEVSEWREKAELRQKFKILKPNPTISGVLEYQMCTEEGQCVQFEYEFDVPIKATGTAIESGSVVEPETPIKTDEPGLPKVDNPDSLQTEKNIVTGVDYSTYKGKKGESGKCEPKKFSGAGAKADGESFWSFFLLAFLAGLAALLTPCVFPMIPMTVTFFLKEGKSRADAIRSGLLYGLSIIIIYTLVGSIVAVTLGADAANFLSTHWVPNVFFFLIFVVFAASFFGAFEIVLPGWLVNKMDAKSDKGGLAGIFFMAFTIVLVSFSCTGPIVGSILVQSVSGQFIKPLIGMFGFSLAFAIPFGLFAIFPNWLSSLPKSGGWLNSVKVVLGFIELALGLKFLSIADQTYHWGILDREVYLALWIIIFTLMGIYLLGKIKFNHDSEVKFIKIPRLFFALVTFTFVVYLIPGMFGAPLKAIAGYLPPMSTHDFNIPEMIREAAGLHKDLCEKPKYGDKLHMPHGLKGYYDYEQGMECARKQGKPVFLDFTGHGCVNCREMEARVWVDPRVLKILKEEYIVISLYVDDKTIDLPVGEQYYSKTSGKLITNLAKKNADIQLCYFGANAQPFYVLMDNKAELLAHPRAYDLNKDEYVKLLEDGVKLYKQRMAEK